METWANKYRPTNLSEVVGQDEAIKLLLDNVVSKENYSCALLVGPPGTGKTTIARIVARTFNPTGNCIVEIDGASNNGVDNIRNIIDKCKLAPIGADYHIYIIDEVHMLSTGAFNALLKILEEPPAHVKFFLCTTDESKVPEAVVSRLLKVPVKPVPTTAIISRLRYIADEEKILVAEPEALFELAMRGRGCVRNAIKYLESCAHNGGLYLDDIHQTLGLPDAKYQLEALELIQSYNVGKLFSLLDWLEDQQIEARRFLESLIEVTYDVLRTHFVEDVPMKCIPEHYRSKVIIMGGRFGQDTIHNLLKILNALLDIEVKLRGMADSWPQVKCELVTIHVE